MSDTEQSLPANFELPRPPTWGRKRTIAAPSYASFTAQFGHAFPKPHFLESDLGSTAIYDLLPPSGQTKRPVLMMHGVNTPALGLWLLAKDLQALDPDTHIVLFDLWGHGLSSTPLVTHTPQIFHSQIFQVLSFMQWTHAHIIGYSFGAATAMRFAVYNSWAVLSVAVLGPAGLLRKTDFPPRMQELLDDSQGKEAEARDCVLSWLEGGPLEVPADWRERVKSGEVVAAAFRDWELREHLGYPYSIFSMIRDGGIYECHDDVREFASLSLKKIGIVGGSDPVCSKSQLTDVGFENVEVIAEAGHAFVRDAHDEVAQIIHRFWTQ